METKPICRSCDRPYTPPQKGESFGFCRKKLCSLARTTYLKINWDLMGDCKHKTRYESDFYELNDLQREHYSSFLAMVKPKRNLTTKGRRCMKCRISMESQTNYTDHHICGSCHESNAQYGARA